MNKTVKIPIIKKYYFPLMGIELVTLQFIVGRSTD